MHSPLKHRAVSTLVRIPMVEVGEEAVSRRDKSFAFHLLEAGYISACDEALVLLTYVLSKSQPLFRGQLGGESKQLVARRCNPEGSLRVYRPSCFVTVLPFPKYRLLLICQVEESLRFWTRGVELALVLARLSLSKQEATSET